MKVLTLVLLIAACAASGCKKIRGAEGTETSTSAAVASATADPKGNVVAASRKLIASKALSAIVIGDGELGIKKDVQFLAPDRYHIKFDDSNGAHVEMVSIGNETFIRNGEAWDKLEMDESPTSTFRNNFSDEVLDTISNVKFEGEDTLDQRPTLVFTYDLVTKVGSFPVTQRIWVDQESGLPVKSIAEYHSGNMKTLTTTFDAKSPVSIEPPAK